MLNKDDMTRDTLRMFKSEVQKFEIDNQETVDDAKALSIINKMIKQRNDSIAQFTSGGRSDLAEKEQLEVNVLSKYKPNAACSTNIPRPSARSLAPRSRQRDKKGVSVLL